MSSALAISSHFGNDAERVLERQRVDDLAERVLRVDPVAQVDDAVAQVAGEDVPRRRHDLLAHRLQVAKLNAFGIEQLVGAVAQVHEVTSQGAHPNRAGSACVSQPPSARLSDSTIRSL